MNKTKALVILSGGQDSVTCLAWAKDKFDAVEAITFNYGQRHNVELMCARAVCRETGTPHKVIDMEFFGELSVSALTGDGDVNTSHELNENLPASFVPGRNAMFLAVAHAWAQSIEATNIVLGVCQTDYSGYPDCRHEFVSLIVSALNIGSDTNILVDTPLMYLTKGQTFDLAADLGPEVMQMVLELSHTCYEGDRTVRHAWGYGCGVCPACKLRASGWTDFLIGAETEHVTQVTV